MRNDHDGLTERSISGRFRSHAVDAADRYRVRGARTRLYLGDLGDVGHFPCLAERPSGLVRCDLECTARQHCADGVGILSAVRRKPSLLQLFGEWPRYLGEIVIMMKTLRKSAAAIGLLAASTYQSAWAALPTPVAPSTAPAAGDWIALIKGYIKDGGLVLGLAIAVLGFLWIAYLGFSKFNEARQGKAEWAEVGVLGIVGAIVLIFASYLLTEAAGVI